MGGGDFHKNSQKLLISKNETLGYKGMTKSRDFKRKSFHRPFSVYLSISTCSLPSNKFSQIIERSNNMDYETFSPWKVLNMNSLASY